MQKGKENGDLPKGTHATTQRLQALIRGVAEEGKAISYVAKKLNVRYSIARNLVVAHFQQNGLDYEKKDSDDHRSTKKERKCSAESIRIESSLESNLL
jgi:transposase